MIGTSSLSLPDRRVLLHPALEKDRVEVVSHSTNADAGGPRSSMLRPGNVLLADAGGTTFYDDAATGVPSTPATVTSTLDIATWNTKTLILYLNGGTKPITVTGTAADTAAQAVIDCNDTDGFGAHFLAEAVGSKLKITCLDPNDSFRIGAGTENDVGGANATFTANAVYYPTAGDYVVTLDYCDQLDTGGSASSNHVPAVRAGVFKESNLIWGGSSTLPEDFKRVMLKRGARFE